MSRPGSGGKKPQAIVSKEVENELRSYETWLRRQPTRISRNVSDNTIRAYTQRVRSLLAKVGLEPTADNVKDFVDESTRDRKNATFNGWVFGIKKYSQYRVEIGKTNGFAKYLKSLQTSDREVDDPITREELDALVAEAAKRGDETFSVFLRVAWDTLGRADELVSLRWADVEFKPNPKMHTDATVTFAHGKTGRGLKGYLWSPGVADDLRRYRAGAKDSDLVFRKLGYGAADYRLEQLGVALGVERKLHLHLLRAGAAVWLDSKNVPLSVIMALGRWKSLAALQRYLRAGEGLIGESIAKALGR